MSITLQQTLHGYQQGHNLICASVKLSSADEELMTMLSDWTEYTNNRDKSDYITAYPLENSGYYVIAKTWYAQEMNRPGCVWTHSLLISYDDLSKIENFELLASYFKRPVLGEYSHYADLIHADLTLDLNNYNVNAIKVSAMPKIYNNLINKKTQVYGVDDNSDLYQKMVLMLMNFFTAELLRELSFSTGSGNVRTLNDKPFSLQFISGRKDLASVHQSIKEDYDAWINYAVDYINSGNLVLSRLIHTFAEDIKSDSKKLQVLLFLLTLYNDKYLTDKDKEFAMLSIVDTIANNYSNPDEGHLIKQRFLQPSVTSQFVSEEFFLYNICVYDKILSFSRDDLDFCNRFRSFASGIAKQQLYLFLAKLVLSKDKLNRWALEELRKSNELINKGDVIRLCSDYWVTFMDLSSYCPVLLNDVAIEGLSKEKLSDFIALVIREEQVFKNWETLLSAILKLGLFDNREILDLIYKHEHSTIYLLLDFINHTGVRKANDNLAYVCTHDINKVLSWLNRGDVISLAICTLVMRIVNPISNVVRNAVPSCWRQFALFSSHNRVDVVYYSFLYKLSFNWEKDADAMEYLRISFYPLYKKAAENSLDEKVWYSIMPYTDDVPFLLNWDKCKKMRKKVGRRLAVAGKSRDYVSRFTPNKGLNEKLVSIWEKNIK